MSSGATNCGICAWSWEYGDPVRILTSQVEARGALTLVYTIGYVHWFGRNIPEDRVTSPQVLIDTARRACIIGSQEEITTMAEAAFERVQRYKKNGGLRPRSDVESDDE